MRRRANMCRRQHEPTCAAEPTCAPEPTCAAAPVCQQQTSCAAPPACAPEPAGCCKITDRGDSCGCAAQSCGCKKTGASKCSCLSKLKPKSSSCCLKSKSECAAPAPCAAPTSCAAQPAPNCAAPAPTSCATGCATGGCAAGGCSTNSAPAPQRVQQYNPAAQPLPPNDDGNYAPIEPPEVPEQHLLQNGSSKSNVRPVSYERVSTKTRRDFDGWKPRGAF